jgi:catechol 2,3-dioxygenase
MTKTTYLDDPEGNGIELYAESPEDGAFEISGDRFSARRADGTPSDGREPLDLDALMSHLTSGDRLDAPVPEATKIGHVHLHVSDVNEAVRFYHEVVGFDVMGVSKSFQAAFVSAGGYHHHVGLNSWQGAGSPSAPPDGLGLRYFTVRLPGAQELQDVLGRIEEAGLQVETTSVGALVRDPSDNAVVLESRSA